MVDMMKRLAVFVGCLFFSIMVFAQVPTQFGGEIPWPLSNQHVVTVKNSKGLWSMGQKGKKKIFNVEMITNQRSGTDWIRVSELDPKTYEVISWGEGFFTETEYSSIESRSSFWDVTVGKDEVDRHGRYLNMFPNGSLEEHPYLLRVVEVETAVGNVLGLSVLHYVEKQYDHFLGQRIMKEPLSCQMQEDEAEEMSCFIW